MLNRLVVFLIAVVGLALPGTALASFSNTGTYEVTGPDSLLINVTNNGDPWDRIEIEPVNHTSAEVIAGGPATCGPMTAERFFCSWLEGVFKGQSTKIAVGVESSPERGTPLRGYVRYADGEPSEPFEILPAAKEPPAETPPGGQPGQPAGGQPAGGQPSAGQPAGGQPVDGRPTGGQPTGGQQGANGGKVADPPAPGGAAVGGGGLGLMPCRCADVKLRVTSRRLDTASSRGRYRAGFKLRWDMECTGGVGHCAALIQVLPPPGARDVTPRKRLVCIGRCGGRTTGNVYVRLAGGRGLVAPGRKVLTLRVVCFGGKVINVPIVLDVDRHGRIKPDTSKLGDELPATDGAKAPEAGGGNAPGAGGGNAPGAGGGGEGGFLVPCLCADVKVGVGRRANGTRVEFSNGHARGGARNDHRNWFNLRWDLECTGGVGKCAALVKVVKAPPGVRMDNTLKELTCIGDCGGHTKGQKVVRFWTDDVFNDRVGPQRFDLQVICFGGKVIDVPIVLDFDAYGHVDAKFSQLGDWLPAK